MPQWEYCTVSNKNNSHLLYITYLGDGLHVIQKPFDENLWGWCLNTLGLLGWEAICVTTTNGLSWHFKREIRPGNELFTIE